MPSERHIRDERERALWKSMTESSWRYYAWVGFLSAVICWGVYAYITQLRSGLGVTGMRDQIFWGLYIVNFVFFIGISHAGTLISSILRLSDATWRQPVTRLAEAITVAALFIGGLMPVIDLGRPDRLHNIFLYGRIQSNLVWDILSVATYLTGSILFLWLLMVPDIAMLRDYYPAAGRLRKRFYRICALGYQGIDRQHAYLEKANHIMTIVILPLAVSVHTVVAWIFAMSLRPGWQSTIFGPYFVVGAIFSGIAASITAMYVFRRVYHLEGYLKDIHFRNLGYLLLVLTLTYLYFNINEYLTIGYKMAGHERQLLNLLFHGSYAPLFWGVQIGCVLLPAVILGTVLGVGVLRERFVIFGTVSASVLVIIGAWVKRYLVVVPTLSSPFMPVQGMSAEWLYYRPTWVEWAITAASLAGFLLFYTVFSKLFPIVSIWENREPADEHQEKKYGVISDLPGKSNWPMRRTIRNSLVLLVVLIPSISWAMPRGNIVKVPTVLSISSVTSEILPGQTTITAALTDYKGRPVSDASIKFSMKTHFGRLDLGLFSTDEKGEAKLSSTDRRLGKFIVSARFEGNNSYKAAEATEEIDFGKLPEPSLPPEGVLNFPYSTFNAGWPFILFYGFCWIMFAYAFGWLIFWKMRF